MSDRHQTCPESVTKGIFRWPLEGWTRQKISFLLVGHGVRYGYSDTKPELLKKLRRWAEDGRACPQSTNAIKAKVRNAFREAEEAGYDFMAVSISSRHHRLEEMSASRDGFNIKREQTDEYFW